MKNTIGLKDISAALHTTFKTSIVSMGLKLVLRCFFQGDTKMKIQCTMYNAQYIYCKFDDGLDFATIFSY